jgi:heat-inducible transcriptional repressor
MEVLESRHIASSLLPEVLVDEGVKVVIGGENREEAMRGCSVVITRYGIPGEIGGALGVIGPTRMPYERSISAVRYMGSLMSNLVSELCGGPRRQ